MPVFASMLLAALLLAAALMPHAAAQATVVSSSKLQSCIADGTVRCRHCQGNTRRTSCWMRTAKCGISCTETVHPGRPYLQRFSSLQRQARM